MAYYMSKLLKPDYFHEGVSVSEWWDFVDYFLDSHKVTGLSIRKGILRNLFKDSSAAYHWLDTQETKATWEQIKTSFVKVFGRPETNSYQVMEYMQMKQDKKEKLRDFILRVAVKGQQLAQAITSIIAIVKKNCTEKCRPFLPKKDVQSIDDLLIKCVENEYRTRVSEYDENASHKDVPEVNAASPIVSSACQTQVGSQWNGQMYNSHNNQVDVPHQFYDSQNAMPPMVDVQASSQHFSAPCRPDEH